MGRVVLEEERTIVTARGRELRSANSVLSPQRVRLTTRTLCTHCLPKQRLTSDPGASANQHAS